MRGGVKLRSRVSENVGRLLKETKKFFPGGVNSPIRSFKAIGIEPIFVKSGNGSKIKTIDGKTYIDYCMSWGALIFGHSN